MDELIVLGNIGMYTNPESAAQYKQHGGYQGLPKALSMSPGDVVEEVKKSGLRGRGGAGFPTGLKWSFTLPLKGEKYVLCNADEGEPGTFKDRVLMEGDPHKVIEGIIIAGYAVGAQKGYIYIRGEYCKSIEMVSRAVEEARKKGYLGENILGTEFSFNIEVKTGAGSYICGEETAMIESLEGKRGNPRVRPPYPGVQGLWRNPSVVNNVETLANIPSIIVKGADWFKSIGTRKSTGTKIFCVSGKVENPGYYELPMTVTLRELIFDYCGGIKHKKKFKAALVGGAAAGAFLGEDNLDVQLNFEDLAENNGCLGSGAVLVLDEEVRIVDVLKNIMEFFVHESCGLCTPCRVGNVRILDILNQLKEGNGTAHDYQRILKIAKVMNKTCLCPLGQSPFVPLSTAARWVI
ncbi:MAG: NADH-quinone oxidoreductase subunit NuoF [Theionarchaea archaeon]|nr:NADH-quinone oxidoreductase subunit NuoF [Theionarchaea archaeon]